MVKWDAVTEASWEVENRLNILTDKSFAAMIDIIRELNKTVYIMSSILYKYNVDDDGVYKELERSKLSAFPLMSIKHGFPIFLGLLIGSDVQELHGLVHTYHTVSLECLGKTLH